MARSRAGQRARVSQALSGAGEPCDYIAFGPVFPTKSKENPDPVVGLDLLREVCHQVHKPIVAIGGVSLERASQALASGARSVAVISDILAFPDIVRRTREWVRYNQSGD